MKLDELVFFRQKICSFNQSNTEEYELLLRKKSPTGYCFPEYVLTEVISNHEKHKLYMEKVSMLLHQQLKNDNCFYSLNLDYQELYFEETFCFFENFEYKDRLRIELTERSPISYQSKEKAIDEIKKIKNLGYRIDLDDFLSGVNTYKTLLALNPYIDRVKISALEFKKYLTNTELQKFIFDVVTTIDFLDKEIVVEGVEEEEVLATFPKNWLQQSFYYDKPHNFS